MMVSPSNPQAVVSEVAENAMGLYEVVAETMFKYCEVFVDWIVPPMLKASARDSGPRTGMLSGD
jgi:hypothetical protein